MFVSYYGAEEHGKGKVDSVPKELLLLMAMANLEEAGTVTDAKSAVEYYQQRRGKEGEMKTAHSSWPSRSAGVKTKRVHVLLVTQETIANLEDQHPEDYKTVAAAQGEGTMTLSWQSVQVNRDAND